MTRALRNEKSALSLRKLSIIAVLEPPYAVFVWIKIQNVAKWPHWFTQLNFCQKLFENIEAFSFNVFNFVLKNYFCATVLRCACFYVIY